MHEDTSITDIVHVLKNEALPSSELEEAIEALEIIAQRTVYWGIDDFRAEGMCICDDNQELYNETYDEFKFPNAIAEMISNHDAEMGITWSTVRAYLSDMCLKD